jgi:hypothetical protein
MHDAPEDAVTTSGPAPLNARIDASRIASAISYFRGRSIGVAAFIPAYALRRKGPGGGRAGGREGGGGNVMMQTEAQESLQSMVDRRWLATIPPTDNDDLYILEFAREKVGDSGGGAWEEGGRGEGWERGRADWKGDILCVSLSSLPSNVTRRLSSWSLECSFFQNGPSYVQVPSLVFTCPC